MDHQLHAARFVEESLEHDAVQRGHQADGGDLRRHVSHRLRGSVLADAAILFQPGDGGREIGFGCAILRCNQFLRCAAANLLASAKLPATVRSCGRALRPARTARWPGLLGIAHVDFGAAHVADQPGCVAQQENVAAVAFHGEIFVHRADERALVFGHHAEIAHSGIAPPQVTATMRAPRRAFTWPNHVAVQPRAGSRPDGNAFAEHRDDAVERFPLEVAIRPGPAHSANKLVFGPFLAGAHGHDLLGQEIQRRHRHFDGIQSAGAHGAQQGQAFDQFIARQRKQPPFGHDAQRVARPADALQERGDRARRADLANQVDVADVDAHLQRRRGDDRFQLATFQSLFRTQANLARQAAVMAATASSPSVWRS